MSDIELIRLLARMHREDAEWQREQDKRPPIATRWSCDCCGQMIYGSIMCPSCNDRAADLLEAMASNLEEKGQ